MDDACLDLSFREGRLDGLGKALETIDDGNQDVLDV